MIKPILLTAICLLAFAKVTLAIDPTAEELAGILTGDAMVDEGANPQCALFSSDEIAAYVGEPVLAGENAGMGMGCQWVAIAGEGDAMVTVVPSEYAERPTLAPGFKEVTSVGPDAFVVPEIGGWAAGVTTGDSFVKVSVAGPEASEESALDLLVEVLKRRGE